MTTQSPRHPKTHFTMKTPLLLILTVALQLQLHAADALTERLQRGLFEEEANRNLDAAIKEYQSVVTQADEQRRVVATALFRLGECYRKLGRTNEAAAFYQRITRDFSEQEQLAKLAADLVKPSPAAVASKSPLVVELERRLATLKVESITQQMEVERLASLSRDDLINSDAVQNDAGYLGLVRQGMAIAQRDAELQAKFGNDHPEVREQNGLRKKLIEQIDQRLKAVVAGKQERAKQTAMQVQVLGDELKKAQNEAGEASRPAAQAPALTQAEADELARVKSLAQNSPDLLNAVYKDGMTSLQFAATTGYYEVAKFLLAHGSSVNALSAGATPPIVSAAGRGHLRIVELLLENGADINASSSGGPTALMNACQMGFKGVAELLLKRGADVNRENSSGQTALHHAVQKGNASIVDLLLKSGAKPDVVYRGSLSGYVFNNEGAAPLHLAAGRDDLAISELLLKAGASVNATNALGRTPLHVAAAVGSTNLCALLIDRGAKLNVQTSDGNTPLMAAIGNTRTETVALLVSRGADVNLGLPVDTRGFQYPIHQAVLRETPPLLSALLAGKPQLEVLNFSGWTALQLALAHNVDGATELLCAAGANPDRAFQDQDGTTLLHYAVTRGRVAPMAALLKAKANPNVINRNGETPLSLAMNSLRQLATSPGGGVLSGGAQRIPGAPGSPGQPAVMVGSGSGAPGAMSVPAYEQIVTLLKEHGADEFLQRRGFISAVRGPQQRVNIFSKGTNDVNRYTLMEFLAAVYEKGGQDFPFPDFAKVTIHRVAMSKRQVTSLPPGVTSVNAVATISAKTSILVDAAKMLANTNDCSGDIPLEWGDEVEIPMADHPVTAQWPGLIRPLMAVPPPGYADDQPSQGQEVFNQCLHRMVRLTAGGTNVTIDLVPAFADLRRVRSGNTQRSPFFRLSNVVLRDSRYRNLLRSSSDLSRVTVTRLDPLTKETKKMTFDLNAVALPDMNYSSGNQPPIPWQHDLWLRDGDVIEVPDKP